MYFTGCLKKITLMDSLAKYALQVCLPPYAFRFLLRVVLYSTSDLRYKLKRNKELFEVFKTSLGVSETQGSIYPFKRLHIFKNSIHEHSLLSTQSQKSKPMSQSTVQSQEQKMINLSFPFSPCTLFYSFLTILNKY